MGIDTQFIRLDFLECWAFFCVGIKRKLLRLLLIKKKNCFFNLTFKIQKNSIYTQLNTSDSCHLTLLYNKGCGNVCVYMCGYIFVNAVSDTNK